MLIYKDLIIFIIGVLVIIKSADFFTAGAEGIARTFGIPRFIIGLTIVSLATTAPEFTVSVISSYMKLGGIAVGNALGSCLANIGLALALAATMRAINFKTQVLKQDLPFLLGIICLVYFLALNGKITFWNGIFLCALLGVFFIYIILREIKNKKVFNNQDALPAAGTSSGIKKDVFKFLIGAAGVVIAAKYALVSSSVNIARFLGVPNVVIGLSLVAVGTSLPELFTALVASVKKMGGLAAGNIVGANILNLLWVLGVSSLVNPLNIDMQIKKLTLPFLFLITLLMFIFCRTRAKLSRAEGLVLFIIYFGYIFCLFKMGGNL
ncbi:MAG: calcium/sodium antiporter [Candidatus Omnitrophica bacterium]|nr:calcium/sodium antiporter [Candidatus Omnitrophota bacterium]